MYVLAAVDKNVSVLKEQLVILLYLLTATLHLRLSVDKMRKVLTKNK